MAGFDPDSKMYFNTRTVVEPSDELKLATPMGKWCYAHLEQLNAVANGKFQTAVHFLKFLCEINRVFLQDAAAMAALHPERRQHPMYQHIQPLNMPEFEDYVQRMKKEIEDEKNPLDAQLEHVLPGIFAWHSAQHAATQRNALEIGELRRSMENAFAQLQAAIGSPGPNVNVAQLLRSIADVMQNTGRGGDSSVCTDFVVNPNKVAIYNTATGSITRVNLDDNLDVRMDGDQDSNQDEQAEDVNHELTLENSTFQMRLKHTSLVDMWDEWNSPGGVADHDKKFKAKWRKSISNDHYSRTKRTIEGIKTYADQRKIHAQDAAREMDPWFQECKCSVSAMVRLLQEKELVAKKQARGRTKK
jgi:hypothetical protein